MERLVSILISAYDSERWIGYTLQPAVSRTWKRKEIIAVNDGSTDRTREEARRYSPPVTAVVSTECRGVSPAENEAFRHRQRDYIQRLDWDDTNVSVGPYAAVQGFKHVGAGRASEAQPLKEMAILPLSGYVGKTRYSR